MSGQSIVTIELGRSDKTGNNSVGAGAGAGAPEPEAAVADYRTQSTTTRYNTDCKDLALQSLKCQEKLQAGTSRNPCAEHIMAYRNCIEAENERIRTAKYGPKKPGMIW